MVTLHVPPIVLWRESNVWCECACVSSKWTLRLGVGSMTVAERVGDRIAPLLSTAQRWRQNLATTAKPVDTAPPQQHGDRRRNASERRAAGRGGRRAEEPYRSDRHTVVLLAEVARLRDENALLREAALTFGALAERLTKRQGSTAP